MKPALAILAPLLLNGSYAMASEDVSTYIVGGTESIQYEWPWMVYVQAETDEGYQMCGGTLIDESTVLTAAHCLYDEDGNEIAADNLLVAVGGYDITEIAGTSEEYITSITKTYIHSDYDTDHFTNDIALLQLKRSSDDITPLDRADSATTETLIDAEDDGTVIGWGSTTAYDWDDKDITYTTTNVLRDVSVPLNSDNTCTDVYGDYYDSKKLCAGGTDEGTGSCQGDSGGPLIAYESGSWQQIGIVSFGTGCASEGFPSVYTRVSEFNNWISNIIAGVTIEDTLTSFTQAKIGETQTQTITITNNSDTDTAITFELIGDAVFSLDNEDCESITANSSCELQISYSPTANQSSTMQMTIINDLVDGTDYETTLSGTPLGFTTYSDSEEELTTNSSTTDGGGSNFFILCFPLLWLRRRFCNK